MCRGKQAYDLRAEGLSWGEVAKKLGIDNHKARTAAYDYRVKHGLANPFTEQLQGKAAAAKSDPKSQPATTNAADQKQIRELQRIIEKQQKALDAARQPRVKFFAGSDRKADAETTDHVRVIVPDSHGCKIDKRAAAAFLADLKALQPTEIVMLGDHVDCGGFLAQHHTLGYVAESEYTFEQDVAAANAFLDEIQERCPNATIHYLLGNHERRIETWCVTQSLKNQIDAAYLKKLFGIPTVLNFESRGIKHYDQGVFYQGLSIPATIKLGKCYFTHGSRTGKYSAAAMLSDFGGNVVFGHIHTIDSATRRTVTEGGIGSWCVGCLCEFQPMWMHTQITNWSHGYGVQFVTGEGDFLHVNVPIVDGKSLLVPLTRSVA